jgi:hypothetical protein
VKGSRGMAMEHVATALIDKVGGAA